MTDASTIGRLAGRHRLPMAFIAVALCLAGVWSAYTLPSSVFPQTDFPRCVILVDNGTMPADEMMATITRPIEEAVKDIPGVRTVRSATGRGSAEINVFFDWDVDMVTSELYVNGRLARIRSQLPDTASSTVWRLTFAAFPILGISLTSPTRDLTHLWEAARYDIKPRLLQIHGVARVDLVGGRAPEYHVIVDPIALAAAGLELNDVTRTLQADNQVVPAGMHEEDHTLYLTVVDGRLHGVDDIAELTVGAGGRLVRLGDVARIERGPEPVFNVVTAEGVPAVLLNVRSQPDGSTLEIADGVRTALDELESTLPGDMKLAYYYDQSLLVQASVRSVWEAIVVGLVFAVAVLYVFLRRVDSTLSAAVVVPITVLITLVAMAGASLSFNLMTLGGIAAAIGLVIDDAIVVVESIHTWVSAGVPRHEAVQRATGEIFTPLVGSTLTPVVVFFPLAFLDGITGVFFRALALTMVAALLTSLLLAVTLTPALCAWLIRDRHVSQPTEAGFMGHAVRVYDTAVRRAMSRPGLTLIACLGLFGIGLLLYQRLDSDFLPAMDEGGFVIDYHTPWGTSLAETDRQLLQAEEIIRAHPDVESYSRRTGARLALAIAEPNTGDFLVKLKPDREATTEEVIADLREAFRAAVPGVEWEFPGILSDLIGDLTWSPEPIEIKLYSPDTAYLERMAPRIEARIQQIDGVVDTSDGLVYTGPTIAFRVRPADARRFGLGTDDVAVTLQQAMLGRVSSYVLEGDRRLGVRVRLDDRSVDYLGDIRELPVRVAEGMVVKLSQVADVVIEPPQLELRREDLRQDVAVTALLEGRDLGSAMQEIRAALAADADFAGATIEYGGLYEQQQASFRNLLLVLAAAVLLVFTVLLFEFRSFAAPLAIVFGSVLSLVGSIAALWLTGTSLNVVSFLGAIIGIGVVAKNGILMLDTVEHQLERGDSMDDALARSGQRRLRPVLMTSLTTLLAMLPLAWGIGRGADMLRPLAIAIIGALCISVLLSLVATPVAYQVMSRLRSAGRPG